MPVCVFVQSFETIFKKLPHRLVALVESLEKVIGNDPDAKAIARIHSP